MLAPEGGSSSWWVSTIAIVEHLLIIDLIVIRHCLIAVCVAKKYFYWHFVSVNESLFLHEAWLHDMQPRKFNRGCTPWPPPLIFLIWQSYLNCGLNIYFKFQVILLGSSKVQIFLALCLDVSAIPPCSDKSLRWAKRQTREVYYSKTINFWKL